MDTVNKEASMSSRDTFIVNDDRSGQLDTLFTDTSFTSKETIDVLVENTPEFSNSEMQTSNHEGLYIECQEHKHDAEGDYDEISHTIYVNSNVTKPTNEIIETYNNDLCHMLEKTEMKEEKQERTASVRCKKNNKISKRRDVRQNQNKDGSSVSRSTHFKQKAKVLFKKFLIFLFSQVGLTCVVIAYCIFGAIIFQRLEQWNEKKSRVLTAKLRKDMLNDLWNVTKTFNVLKREPWSVDAEKVLRNFEQDIYIATKQLGWDGISDEAESELHWSFTGSLLYSVTVITTIGYGHITPKTQWGRIVTMIYAFFGIPLTLLCLANIGALMGKGFQMLYNKIPVIRSRQNFGLKSALPIPQTTIHTEKSQKEDGSIIEEKNVLVYIPSRQLPPPADVPIIVCSLLVVTYTLVGTVIFLLWETSWDVLTSAYFCFITLSTIGFGDVVPGHSLDSWQSQPKQFLCTIYLLFGLTLLAMCFDLLQEQVRSMATRFGEFIGIIDEEEVEEEIVEEEEIEKLKEQENDNRSTEKLRF